MRSESREWFERMEWDLGELVDFDPFSAKEIKAFMYAAWEAGAHTERVNPNESTEG